MALFDLFSKRQKRLRGEVPDVFTYDNIPQPLRLQIVHIWRSAIGVPEEFHARQNMVKEAYITIVEVLCREYGVFCLVDQGSEYLERDFFKELIKFFLSESNIEKVLDVIELSFRTIEKVASGFEYRMQSNASELADESIAELNSRFKEHGVGYQFESGEIIRVDSQLLHSEVVKPTLQLLSNKAYAGAQQEFLKAYEHYRHGNHKEALNEALKSFESTMKTICQKRKWAYDPNDSSKKLIEICYEKGLVPTFWQQNMSALRGLLEGGVPTGRNKLSGHGQGTSPIVIPDYIVSYILHMTAAAIVFLAKGEEARP